MSKRRAAGLSMESIVEFILRVWLAAVALLASMVKTTFRKWSAVDPASAIVCVGMFVISLLTWNSYLLLCWMGAAACLSIAAVNGWQWNLVADLRSLRKGDLLQAVKGSNLHVDVVGQPVDMGASAARRQTTGVERTASLLRNRIVGQDQAVEAVISGLESAAVGTRANNDRPLSFLMIGPTGVGKTETAKLTANGLRFNFYVVPMEDHKDKEGLWQLLGTPQGFYGGEGMLTREVATHRQTVLLFDELEKAAREMMDVFLRMLDEGKVRDRKTDQDIDFSRCVIFFTSNLITNFPRDADQNTLRSLVQKTGALRPELVARMGCIVPFHPFSDSDMCKITEMQLTSYLEQVCRSRHVAPRVTLSRGVIEYLAMKQESKFGARNVTSSIEQHVEPVLRKALLAHNANNINSLAVDSRNNQIVVTII
jgi:ATP-dependent Clp protease ATP-binding subunit ClpA